jgi:ubiquinone/menaquinone biosynthesis C-methylase UbiE
MIAKLFLTLTDYPSFRRIIWKPLYEVLAQKIQIDNWNFMNYGYAPFEHENALTLKQEDEINRYPLQLYHYLATTVDISQKEILEVGSGRGGGAAYIENYLKPKEITGLDIAHNAVKLANRKHGTRNLKFIQGNAEKLPFNSKSFDVVINVESCHAYGSVPLFLKEVKRVLRPGGFFLCTDMRSPSGMQILKKHLVATRMKIVSEEDITSNVVKAIEIEEPEKQKRIDASIPKWFIKPFKEFAGVKNSKIHTDLQTRALVYHRFVLQKDI